MKILHVYKTFYPHSKGGIETAIYSLSEHLSNLGIVSDIFVLSKQKSTINFKFFNKTTVFYNKSTFTFSSAPFSLIALSKFRELIESYDVIHYHFPNPFGDLLYLFFGRNKPSIVTYHSDIVRQKYLKYLYYPLQLYFLKNVEKIVCTSPNYLKTSSTLQKFKAKLETISIGIDTSYLQKPSIKLIQKWRKIYEKPYFLFLGVLRDYKGINTLIEAASKVKCNIIIAGGGNNYDKYVSIAKKKKLKNLFFTNELNDHDKNALLYNCYGFVLPSTNRAEAFGIVQLEAAFFSKPLICTELGTGTTFINENNTTGLVVEPNNPVELSNAINYLIKNPAIARKMGQQAKEKVKKDFLSIRMCDEYFKIYSKLLNPN